jgi:hypothetical protein
VTAAITGIPNTYIKKEVLGKSLTLELQNIPLGKVLKLNSLFKTGGEEYPYGAKLTADIEVTFDKSQVHYVNINNKKAYNNGTLTNVEFTDLSLEVFGLYGLSGPFDITLELKNIIADMTPPDQGVDINSVVKTPVWSSRPGTAQWNYTVNNEFLD